MSILGKDVTYNFVFTATSKKGEYFFNRFIKIHNFIEVKKTDNIYSGFAKLSDLNNLTSRSLYKYGKLDLGKPDFSKTVIAM